MNATGRQKSMTWMSYTSLANIIPTQCFKVAWEVVGLIPQVMGSGNFPGIEVDKKNILKITFYILEYTLISIWKLLCTVCTEVQKNWNDSVKVSLKDPGSYLLINQSTNCEQLGQRLTNPHLLSKRTAFYATLAIFTDPSSHYAI